MFLADLHMHSTFSDGHLELPDLIDNYGERGFGAIAVTDHLCESNTFLGHAARWLDRTLTPQTFPAYLNLLDQEIERAWDQYKMLVIPGFEITKNSLNFHKSAHIVALGVKTWIDASQEIDDIIDQIHDAGGLAIAAHPVSTKKIEAQTFHLWSRRYELAQKMDAWEVASGKEIFELVAKSGLPMLANSDLHHPSQISSWKTAFHCERHPEAIMKAIKQQDLDFRFYSDELVQPTYAQIKHFSAPLKVANSF
jgi:PHP family Zn ribbon phosphoesterase